MRKPARLLGAGILASLILASAVATASAGRLEVSNQNFRIVFSPLRFETGGGTPINCTVTMEGTFHYRTILKVARSLIGYVTRAIVARPCSGFGQAYAYNGTEGELTSNVNSLPWHVTYEGFTGSLPAIATIRLLLSGWRFILRGALSICLSIYGPNRNASAIAIRRAETGAITGIEPDGTIGYAPEANPGGECGTGFFSGLGATTVLGRAEAITVRLI